MNITTQITPGKEPVLSISPVEFTEKASDGVIHNIPTQYFRATNDDVVMDAELASVLEWTLISRRKNKATLETPIQTVTIRNESYDVPKRAFTTRINAEDLKKK